METVKCPNCGKEIVIIYEKKQYECPHCGQRWGKKKIKNNKEDIKLWKKEHSKELYTEEKLDLEFVQDVRERVRFFQEKPVIIVMELEP